MPSVVYGAGRPLDRSSCAQRTFFSGRLLPGGGTAFCFSRRLVVFWYGAGAKIVISPEPGIEQRFLLRMYVRSMMMACLLHQRGFYVLHASVVQIADYCHCFSRTRWRREILHGRRALHARGHAVVTDDLRRVHGWPASGPHKPSDFAISGNTFTKGKGWRDQRGGG